MMAVAQGLDTAPLDTEGATVFEPAAWLRSFEAAGGGYVLNDEGLSLCWAIQGASEIRTDEARRLIGLVEFDGPSRDELVSFIASKNSLV